MDIFEAMRERHSVRSYTGKRIDDGTAAALRAEIDEINRRSGMNFQLNINEPHGFEGTFAMYGRFDGVTDYIVAAGREGADVEVGYYGESLVLSAQMLGLNSCWVARTYNEKSAKYDLRDGEKLYSVISLGYGKNAGVPHISKKPAEVSNANKSSPEWFADGVAAALLAPSAMNRQNFFFELSSDGETVIPKVGDGPFDGVDMGIAQYHFDIGSGRKNFGK